MQIPSKNYLYFSFNGKMSSVYNLCLTSEDGITIVNSGDSSTSFVQPLKQNRNYSLGVSAIQKSFSLECAAIGLSYEKYKEMMLWLTPGTVGDLVLHHDPYWSYEVIVDNVSNSKYYVGDDDEDISIFTVTFKSVGINAARGVVNAVLDMPESPDSNVASAVATNEQHIPEIVWDNTNKCFYLLSVSNKQSIVNFSCRLQSTDTTFEIKVNDRECVSATNLSIGPNEEIFLSYYGDLDLILDENTDPIELNYEISNINTMWTYTDSCNTVNNVTPSRSKNKVLPTSDYSFETIANAIVITKNDGAVETTIEIEDMAVTTGFYGTATKLEISTTNDLQIIVQKYNNM